MNAATTELRYGAFLKVWVRRLKRVVKQEYKERDGLGASHNDETQYGIETQ